MPFTLTSTAFTDGGMIPHEFTCDGDDHSPPLQWGGAPQNTKSFALIADDPDAPNATFTHWVLFDIPGATLALAPNGPIVGTPGANDFGVAGYRGPCPPQNDRPHGYIFTLYALDTPSLGLQRGASREDVERAMKGHVLARAPYTGRYERRARSAGA